MSSRPRTAKFVSVAVAAWFLAGCTRSTPVDTMAIQPQQVTHATYGHILTNINVWSPDSRRIVYDVRSDPAGDIFDGERIESVDVATGHVSVLYQAQHGAKCGVATYSPTANRVAFIIGPEHPTPDFTYGPARRLGLLVDEAKPNVGIPLDARDLLPPFTAGALRGGSHVHVFSPDGALISFTYEDHVLPSLGKETLGYELNRRTIGISRLDRPVTVPTNHPRNRAGTAYSVLAVDVTAAPRAGSDDVCKAVEETWIGTNGYVRADGSRQRYALAFQGHVLTANGSTIAEVFIVDLPDEWNPPNDGLLQGTTTQRPRPPRGTTQRRLTFTADRRYAGLAAPRHWLRTSPDGSRIAFLMCDDAGIVQVWTVAPTGGSPVQLTHNPHDIASAFSWSPDGRWLAHVMDRQVCLTDAMTGTTTPITPRYDADTAPRPEACVFSPDGTRVAFVRPVPTTRGVFNQIFVCSVPTAKH